MVIGCYRLDGLELVGWSSLDAVRTERGRTGEVMDNSGESTGWNRALFSLASTQLCPSTPAIGAIPGESGSGFQFSGQASPPERGWWGRRALRGEVEPRNWPALNLFVGLQGRGPWILVEVHFLGKVDGPAEPANKQHEVHQELSINSMLNPSRSFGSRDSKPPTETSRRRRAPFFSLFPDDRQGTIHRIPLMPGENWFETHA